MMLGKSEVVIGTMFRVMLEEKLGGTPTAKTAFIGEFIAATSIAMNIQSRSGKAAEVVYSGREKMNSLPSSTMKVLPGKEYPI